MVSRQLSCLQLIRGPAWLLLVSLALRRWLLLRLLGRPAQLDLTLRVVDVGDDPGALWLTQ